MLNHLPHELVLLALANLDLESLHQLRLVSKAWLAFVRQYSDSIHKAAAVLHGFAGATTQLDEARRGYSIPWLEDTPSWEDYCRRFKTLDRAWKGDWNPPAVLKLEATWPLVHRFKIVPDDQLVLLTLGRARAGRTFDPSPVGNLLAVDIAEDRVLWALPHSRVRAYAHCEYDAGFLVFDREGNALEVWRRLSDVESHPLPKVPAAMKPDDHMLDASSQAFRADASSTHGVFVPHALLHVPAVCWAYHVVGTTLVVASQISRKAFLYDVAAGELIATLALDGDWEDIFYVDLDPARHRVFLATDVGLLVYANDTRDKKTVLVAEVLADLDTVTVHTVVDDDPDPPMTTATPRQSEIFWLIKRPLTGSARSPAGIIASDCEILAAHVSPCGNHLAMLSRHALIIVHDFMRTGNTSVPYGVHVVQLIQSATAEYLAFDGRIIAVGTSDGIVLLDLALTSLVYLRSVKMQTHTFSCVQLTREATWATWGSPEGGQRFPAAVLGFNFLGDPHALNPDPDRFVTRI